MIDLEQFAAQLRSINAAFAQRERELGMQVASAQAEAQARSLERDELQRAISRLHSDRAALSDSVARLQAEQEQSAEAAAVLEKREAELQMLLAVARNEAHGLSSQLDAATRALDANRAELDRTREHSANAVTALQRSEAELQVLHAAACAEAKSLRSELDHMRQQGDLRLRQFQADERGKIRQLTVSLDRAHRNTTRLQLSESELFRSRDALRLEVDALRFNLQSAVAELHRLRSSRIWRWTAPFRSVDDAATANFLQPPLDRSGAIDKRTLRGESSMATDSAIDAALTSIQSHAESGAPGDESMNLASKPADATRAPARHVYQLLELRGRAFLEAAYLSILGRAADVEGLYSYLYELSQGASKSQIVALLALSPEGRTRSPDLPGLKALIAREKKLTLGLWPRMLRLLFRGMHDGLERRIRAVEYGVIELNALLASGGIALVGRGRPGQPAAGGNGAIDGQAATNGAIEDETSRLGSTARSVYARLTG